MERIIREIIRGVKGRRLGRNSRRVHWWNGHRTGWGASHQQGFERWARLIQRPDLSPEFKTQIERNLAEKS